MFDRLGNAHAGQRDCHRYNDQTSALDCYYGNRPLWKMLKIVTIRDGAKNTQGEEFTFFLCSALLWLQSDYLQILLWHVFSERQQCMQFRPSDAWQTRQCAFLSLRQKISFPPSNQTTPTKLPHDTPPSHPALMQANTLPATKGATSAMQETHPWEQWEHTDEWWRTSRNLLQWRDVCNVAWYYAPWDSKPSINATLDTHA